MKMNKLIKPKNLHVMSNLEFYTHLFLAYQLQSFKDV